MVGRGVFVGLGVAVSCGVDVGIWVGVLVLVFVGSAVSVSDGSAVSVAGLAVGDSCSSTSATSTRSTPLVASALDDGDVNMAATIVIPQHPKTSGNTMIATFPKRLVVLYWTVIQLLNLEK